MHAPESDRIIFYAVYLCGSVDCFPHAIFTDRDHAKKWGIEHGQSCDGYMIEEVDRGSLGDLNWEGT